MDSNVTELKGVGDKLAGLFKRLGIETVGELINHYPRRYEDFSKIVLIKDIKPDVKSSLVVRVNSVNGRYVRRGMHITEAIVSDDSGSIKVVWFNQSYRAKQIKSGATYLCSGVYEFSGRQYQMVNPSLELDDSESNIGKIVPVYGETKGLKSHQISKVLRQIDFSDLSGIEDVPYKYKIGIREAYRMLHRPIDMKEVELSSDFFDFRELFSIILTSALINKKNEKYKSNSLTFHKDKISKFVSGLEFKLTDAQRKAAWKVFLDMENEKPMNRLVEGDVGSGKTMVAIMATYNAVLNGSQVAIMAPTEVLASQHVKGFTESLGALGIRVEAYSGHLKKSERKKIAEGVTSGDVDVVIGTHALIYDGLDFKNLDLVVVDEQHRFGVNHRDKLVKKSKIRMPHVLTMTATPIPRTLALTVFGDLDISVIDEMPPGRSPVKTKVVSPNSIESIYKKVESEIESGGQCFMIFPLVEDSEKLNMKSAAQSYELLRKGRFKRFRLGLVHGRLKSEEKDEVMKQFVKGDIDILISTTVVEVGVNVPNASVMVIEGADRFGLAQLHQLRGRVGRGERKAYCFLVPSESSKVSTRLRVMESNTDGFKLAEYDLELRGPGAIYGKRQHGELNLDFTKLSDAKKIALARDFAEDFVKNEDELLKYPQLMKTVSEYRTITHLN